MEKSILIIPAKRITKKLILFLESQLLVTLISLPIIVSHGLTISMMSILGNLIFLPLFTMFLIISSAIFFTELLYIPNHSLISMLNISSTYIDMVLSLGSYKWITAYPYTSTLMLVPILTILFINIFKKSFFPLLILFITTLICIQFTDTKKSIIIPFTNNKLQVNYVGEKEVSIVDRGFLSGKRSLDNYITFELKPYILKNFGMVKIKELQITNRPFKTASSIIKNFEVEEITITHDASTRAIKRLKKLQSLNGNKIIISQKSNVALN